MPINDRAARTAAPASPEREPADEALEEFGQRLAKEFAFVKTKLEERSPEQAKTILADLTSLPKEEFIGTVLSLSDDIKIDTLQKSDPKFNRMNTFLRSAGDTAFFGAPSRVAALLEAPFSDKDVGEIIRDDVERTRLMEKAYPGASFTGVLAGFIKGPGGKVFGAGARESIGLTKKLSQAFAKKLESDPKFAARVGGFIDNALTRGAAAGGGGAAAYTATKGTAEIVADTALGAKPVEEVPEAFVELAKKTGAAAEEGATWGAGFAATGLAGAGLIRTGKAAFRKGAKLLGKDLRFQTENLELVQEVMESTPELVIAESAEKMAPVLAREQAKLRAIQTASKNEVTQALKDKSLKLSRDFQANADELSAAVNELRQANETGVARAATRLNEAVGKTFSELNRNYGKKWDAIIEGNKANVSLQKPLEMIEGILRTNGALNRVGKLQPGVQWAKDNPELFSSLSELWSTLGGEVKAAGGGPGITKNLRDTISLQRRVGELADFGRSGGKNYFGRVHRDLYFKLRDAAEEVAPDLKPLNRGYAADRGKIDDFREVMGKNERAISQRLHRDLLNNRQTFVREAIEGFSGLTEETAAAAGEGAEMSRRLQLVQGFRKDPKGVFGQLRRAYQQNDTLTLSALERIAGENPGLKPFLDKAKLQAELSAQMPKPGAGSRAVTDPEVGRLVREAAPETGAAIDRAQAARTQSQNLQKVLPENPLELEKRLGSQGFAPEGTLEARVVQEAAAANPELAQPVKRAEAARVTERIRTGKGMEKHALEELPILGDTLFALRKMATPVAGRLLNVLGRAKPKTRASLISDIWDDLEGSQAFPKASLAKLPQSVGPEAALVIYASQPGGAEDIIRAAEKTGIALSGDDDAEAEQNRAR